MDLHPDEQPVSYVTISHLGSGPVTIPVYARDVAAHDGPYFVVDHAGSELAAAAAAVDADPIGTLHAIADAHRIEPDYSDTGEHGDIDALRFAYTHRGRPGLGDD